MNARVTETLVELRLTGGVMIAIKALTGETVDSIDTRSSIVTGVDCTLIDIDVTHFSCVGKKKKKKESALHISVKITNSDIIHIYKYIFLFQ